MNKQISITAALAGLAAAGLAACTTTAAVDGQFQARADKAGDIAAVSTLRYIAVLPFTGPNGDEFTRELVAQLQAATDQGKPFFNVASGDVMKVRSGASGSDAQSIANAAAFGKQNNLTGVYFGRTDSSVQKVAYTEQRSKCIDKKCKNSQTYTVNCTKVTAAFTAFPQVVAVKGSTVAYARTVSQSATESYCSDQVRSGTDGALLGQALTAAALEVRRDVAPYSRTLQVEVKKAGEGMSKAQKEQFDGAVAFVTAGRMDRACGTWEALLPDLQNNVAELYNLGVCAETGGDFKKALEYYTKADGKLTKPDDMINRALVRAKALSEGKEAPKQQTGTSLTNSLTNMFKPKTD